MKAIFGVLMLIVVLAIVGKIAKNQLSATGSVASRGQQAVEQAATTARDGARSEPATRAMPGGFAGAVAADPNAATVPNVSRSLQDQTRDRTVEALRQGTQRNEQAPR